MSKGGASVARAGAKTAPSLVCNCAIIIPAKAVFHSFVLKDDETGLEFHKNKEIGFNVYSPSGELVGVYQPNVFGGFDVYDRNGFFNNTPMCDKTPKRGVPESASYIKAPRDF